ncbi:MAG TPA: pyridoxamine 5'-phosphate oxidase family protein [Thermoleophilaceae bacterium]|jgi:PPOX class probable F420-dependent enzyme
MLESARVGHLGLLDDRERPRVQPVTFALCGGALYSAVDQKPKRPGEPARVRYLRRRPEAALTVDVYDDDWSRLGWVQVLGRVELLDPSDDADAMAALAAKYEQYRADPPPGPLLKLVPERTLHWRAAH